jgi:hypothetical protein
MSDTQFELFMERLTLREHMFAVYDQDVCIGDVPGVSESDAENFARAKYGFKDNAPIHVTRLK